MERRLQLLLDAERYARLAGEAERSGRSVAAVIREAIDFRFPGEDDASPMQAAVDLLSLSRRPDSAPGEDPADLKSAYADHLEAKLAPR